jgi:putative membrane protein
MQLTVLVGLVAAIGVVAFALQNNVPVTVTFLVWRFDSALAMVLLVAAAVGALVIALLSTPAVLRLQWDLTRRRRQIASLEQANAELRAEIARRSPGAAAQAAPPPTGLDLMAPRRPS